MEYLWFLWFLCPILGGWIAHKKGRRIWLWAIISYFTLWGLLVLLILPSKKIESVSLQGAKRLKTQSGNTFCPQCHSKVSADWKNCTNCGAILGESGGYYCAECGNNVEDDWDICAHCGAKLA